jgi:hypothetical protein
MPGERNASRNKIHVDDDCLAGHDCDGNVARCSDSAVVISPRRSAVESFNTSEFLGALLTSALQNSYYPRQDRTLGDTMDRFSGALSSDVIGNLLREFTPDIKRLFRRHAPKNVLRIEEKLPIPAEDKL